MADNATRDITAFLRQRVVPPGGSRHGLVVGIEQYGDPRLNLRCAVADAKAIFDLMIDPDCGMFPKDNVRLLLNEEATREGIWRALAALRRSAGENDTVWVYYAGHAAPEESSLYWVTHDADVDDLYGTGLSNDQISKVLEDIRAKRMLVLLDCCHAAATAAQKNPTRAVLTADEVFSCYKGHGRITLSSSDGKEKSVELGDVGHGAFTYFLEQGLRGEADSDGDGVVTADELWRYLRSKVADASQKAGNAQTPVLLGEMRHDFALSLNPLEFGRRQSIAEAIRNLVGVGSDQLTTEEGRTCLELLRRDAHNEAERDLMAEFASLLEGRLRISTLRRLIDDVVAYSRHSPTPIPPAATPVSSPKASASPTRVEIVDNLSHLLDEATVTKESAAGILNDWSTRKKYLLHPLCNYATIDSVRPGHLLVVQVQQLHQRRTVDMVSKGIALTATRSGWEFLGQKPLDDRNIPELTDQMKGDIARLCPDCRGSGIFLCRDCYGSGQALCTFCDGVGRDRSIIDKNKYYSKTDKCPMCNGKGLVQCRSCSKTSDGAPCGTCNGTGLLRRRDVVSWPEGDIWSVPADAPKGFTKASLTIDAECPVRLQVCMDCKGTGVWNCPTCRGDGEAACTFCDGVGRDRSIIDKNKYYSKTDKCPMCNGTGKMMCIECGTVSSHKCDRCMGSGLVAEFRRLSVEFEPTKRVAYIGPEKYSDGEAIGLCAVESEEGALPTLPSQMRHLNEYPDIQTALRDVWTSDSGDTRAFRGRVDVSLIPVAICDCVYEGKAFSVSIVGASHTVREESGKCPREPNLFRRLWGHMTGE